MLKALQFQPGVVRDTTRYANTGSWWDCDKVRFRNGLPESWGGWLKYSPDSFTGVARSMHRWSDLLGNVYTGIGTTVKFYVESGGDLTDVTPIRQTNSNVNNALTTTLGSSIITAAVAGHNANEGDYVIISQAADVGGITAATYINKEHLIQSVPTTGTFTIDVGAVASSAAVGGGANTDFQFLYFSGLNATVTGTGWGAGAWGRGAWGSASPTDGVPYGSTRIWTMDNFGEDLIVNARNGALFYWDASNPTTRMVNLTTLAGASNVPTVATMVMVSDQSRHVIAFGANPLGSSTQDPMLIRWSDQEDAADWTPTTINQSGDLRLSQGSKIVTAIQTKSDILIWTDIALYRMQYIGGQFVFGVEMVAMNTYIMGMNSAVAIGNDVFWMGSKKFHFYNGVKSDLPSSLESWLFNHNLDSTQGDKCFAAANSIKNEVIWFYQSEDGTECDKYVAYNYVEGLWYFGNLARTSWIEDPAGTYPIAASTDLYLYSHEIGHIDGSIDPPQPLGAYIESSPMEINSEQDGQGGEFVFIDRVIPDVTFHPPHSTEVPTVTLTVKASRYPGSAFYGDQAFSVAQITAGTNETFTPKKNIRIRGRSFVLRCETETESWWRLGVVRADVRPDGRR